MIKRVLRVHRSFRGWGTFLRAFGRMLTLQLIPWSLQGQQHVYRQEETTLQCREGQLGPAVSP